MKKTAALTEYESEKKMLSLGFSEMSAAMAWE